MTEERYPQWCLLCASTAYNNLCGHFTGPIQTPVGGVNAEQFDLRHDADAASVEAKDQPSCSADDSPRGAR